MSDETHFCVNGEVYKQNGRNWAANNPLQIRRRPPHSPRVTVWFAVSSFTIVGPHYFFESENGEAVTMTADHYINLPHNLRLQFEEMEYFEQLWLPQDRAVATPPQ
jgi:hypothetical protein